MNTHTISHYPARGNCLDFLDKSIHAMFFLIDRYVDTWTVQGRWDDRPYHVNERATLSVLAGAIWRSNTENFVIEEICGEKSDGEIAYRGRYDVWFIAEGRSCYGEAKQVWPIPSTFKPATGDSYTSILRQEAEAAARSKSPLDHHALGILFAVPSINQSRISTARDHLARYHDRLGATLDAWARHDGYHVLWGKYLRDDLLRPEAFHESMLGSILTCPELDVIVATKPA